MPKHRDLPVTLSEEGFVIQDQEIGSVHFLNPAAAVVWSCCDGKTTVRQCAYRIRRKFLTPPFADVPHLIRELLAVFLQLNLVTNPQWEPLSAASGSTKRASDPTDPSDKARGDSALV
jgi:hypothetical protein